MVNEIKGSALDSVIQNLGNSQKAENTQHNAAKSDTVKSPSGESSDVTLTNTAEQLRTLESKIQQQPVVDTQRVQALKQSIFDGTFNIDSKSTADKMAEFENLLSTSNKSK